MESKIFLDRRKGTCYANCTNTHNTLDTEGSVGHMIVLDYRDSRPLYQQVKDSLRRMMLTGLLEPEEKLPSVRSLATQLAINPNTIQRAYAELEAEGYIYSVTGRGSFVSAGDGEHARRIAELTQQLRPLVEELKSLGCTQAQLLALWEGGDEV